MAKKLKPPCPATKKGLPWELKYKFVRGQMTTLFKGFMYVIREKFGAATALELAERMWKFDDRNKKMTTTLKDVFNIEGNDINTIMTWWEIFYELVGVEATWLEMTKTIARLKITECPWSTPDPKDINGWEIIFNSLITKTINPKATVERPKAMCAGDPYCEYVWRIEE